jgi:hypothetical protein
MKELCDSGLYLISHGNPEPADGRGDPLRIQVPEEKPWSDWIMILMQCYLIVQILASGSYLVRMPITLLKGGIEMENSL